MQPDPLLVLVANKGTIWPKLANRTDALTSRTTLAKLPSGSLLKIGLTSGRSKASTSSCPCPCGSWALRRMSSSRHFTRRAAYFSCRKAFLSLAMSTRFLICEFSVSEYGSVKAEIPVDNCTIDTKYPNFIQHVVHRCGGGEAPVG